jgi:hypothetical protein
MKFQRRIGRDLYQMTNVDWRNQREALQQDYQRRSERTHKRETVSRADQYID